ncbi:MAG TPA: endonuclease/exonuclease/phosphatase family protein [Opitutaceae bacterium]|nr:endonuclease/exonuclease/phosphatase family protein [Opitutaceae bacterium]
MFRVLQFNMQFGMAWDAKAPDSGPVDIKATVGEIRRHKPDIVLLQEVEHAQFGGVQIEPPPNYSLIKEALREYDSWFSYPKADPRELPFGIGLAIFSRTRLLEKLRIDVPSPAIEFVFRGRKTTPTDRVMIGAKTLVNGREVQIYNVHLLAFFMLGISSTMYPWQRDLVADRLAASDLPTILGGDFNVSQDDPIVEQFAEHGYATVQHKVPTWRRQPFVLDHIFFNSGLRCIRHHLEDSNVSDHLPLVADFDLAG